MSGYNLPPGCSESDIPGNRPEDMEWDGFWEWAEANLGALEVGDAYRAVRMGILAINAYNKEGADR